ncbi:MAG TPA: 2-phospho-L-lactate transferase [Candidatus Nitrosopolaris sp.]|nr:2-phospho-L-lactate transferase [Candidatus Nitrosopolaris sp.]
MRTVVLAGGTGGAKLAAGFQSLLQPGELTVIANTADDDEFWGLLVSPDIDSTIYRLAGVFDDAVGYGQKGDTFNTLEALGRLGEPTWFRIGDRDLATHVLRADMLDSGCRITETALELCRRFGVPTRVLPMTDDKVRTRFITDRGTLSFQEYFVRERLAPALSAIEIAGADSAEPSPEVTAALVDADLVVIGPSNPLISIGPILEVIGPRLHRERTVAVTPIVGGRALKGPTIEMLKALDHEPSPSEVARRYASIAATFVLDSRDADAAAEIEALGYRVIVCDTVMGDGGEGLASAILEAV